MTLTIQDLGALGEFFGSIAVLATLIYLALQTRQNTMAITAEVEAARNNSLANLYMSLTQPGNAEAFAKDMVEGTTVDDFRVFVGWQNVIQNIEWQFDQARRGVMPGFSADRIAGTVGNYFAISHSFAAIWDSLKANHSPEFVEWVEEQRSKAA
jgi:hypothetical protein